MITLKDHLVQLVEPDEGWQSGHNPASHLTSKPRMREGHIYSCFILLYIAIFDMFVGHMY